VELEFLFCIKGVHTQIDVPRDHVQADKIVSSLRQLDKIDLCVFIDTKIVFPAEMNFCPAILGSQLIARHNRQIDRTFFIAHILSSLDKDISVHIIQTRKRIAIIFFFLG
jgi:hypothetical protein